MKVGTDGVLLGAWAPLPKTGALLDLGTGTGLLALMVAQRNPNICIDAIEIDPKAAAQANANVRLSVFNQNIRVIETAWHTWQHKAIQYDSIICNPPFFYGKYSHSPQRQLARHIEALPPNAIFMGAAHCLKKEGTISLIYPFALKGLVEKEAQIYGFGLQQCTHVFASTLKQDTPTRVLLCFKKECKNINIINSITIETAFRHRYTPEFIALTRPFYINMP